MTFRNHNSKLNIQRDAVSVADFLNVYHAITGRTIPVRGRTDFLVEYRFKQDKDTGEWIGNRESVYEQLRRNYGFDGSRYPDFEALLRMSGNPTPTFVPSINPKSRVKPLIYENNPYVSKENDMATTDPAANVPFKAVVTPDKAEEKTAEDSPAMKLVKQFVNDRRKATSNVSDKEKKAVADVADTTPKEAESAEKKRGYHRYTAEDDKLIIAATKDSFEELAKKLGVSVKQLQWRRNILVKEDSVEKSDGHAYTLEEDMLILSRKLSDKEIAKEIGVSVLRVRRRRNVIQKEKGLITEERLKKQREELDAAEKNGESDRHRFSYGEDCLILFSDVPEKTLALRIGITIRQVRRRKAKLKETNGIHSIAELKAYHSGQVVVYEGSELESASEAAKRLGITRKLRMFEHDEPLVTEKAGEGTAEDMSENVSGDMPKIETKEPKKAEGGAKAGELIDRMMDLMSDFETLVRGTEGKDAEIRAKERYEHLLKALIEKDLQFFALTAGDDKVGAQDRYLSAVGFTREEIAYFRSGNGNLE